MSRTSRIVTVATIIAALAGCGEADPEGAASVPAPSEQAPAIVPPDSAPPVGARAPCTPAGLVAAVHRDIDMLPVTVERKACARGYMVAEIDIGQSACPPEATAEQREACARVKLSFWRSEHGAWQILTYASPLGPCRRAAPPRFPSGLCDRLR